MTKSKCRKVIQIFIWFFCTALLTVLTGCAACSYKGYSGNYPDLYTVAINSLLWNKGHSDKTDRFCDSEINILEKDEIGRILYIYYEDYYVGDTISFSSLIISQYSVDGYVYYYEDCNCLIKEQIAYTAELNEFSGEEIEELKKANDWGKELDLSKCIKKQVVREKQGLPYNEEIKSKVKQKFKSDEGNTFIDYLTNDINGNFILYGVVRAFEKQSDYFVAFVNSEGEIIDWLIPENLYAYQEELKNFKQKNGWQFK